MGSDMTTKSPLQGTLRDEGLELKGMVREGEEEVNRGGGIRTSTCSRKNNEGTQQDRGEGGG